MASSRRRLLQGLLASIALHALIALALRSRPLERPSPPMHETNVEVIELPRSPPARPQHASSTKAASHHRLHIESLAPAAAGPSTSRAENSAAVEPPPSNPAPSHLDLAAAGTAAAGRAAVAAPVTAREEHRGVEAPAQLEDPDARVAAMIDEAQGRDRVQRGLIDPYFAQLAKSLVKGWNPEPAVVEKGLEGYLSLLGENLKDGVKAYVAGLERYGRTGSPAGPGYVRDKDHEVGDPGIQDWKDAHEQLEQMFTSSRVALVRLTQGLDGHLLAIELMRPSVDPAMDAEILRELRSGEMVLPVPPRKGQGIRSPIRSLWAFQLVVSISPPVPVITGSFEETSLFDKTTPGGLDLRVPLDRRIYKFVQLISVD